MQGGLQTPAVHPDSHAVGAPHSPFGRQTRAPSDTHSRAPGSQAVQRPAPTQLPASGEDSRLPHEPARSQATRVVALRHSSVPGRHWTHWSAEARQIGASSGHPCARPQVPGATQV